MSTNATAGREDNLLMFQSLVRVVLNEHTAGATVEGNIVAVSIPRSGCAE